MVYREDIEIKTKYQTVSECAEKCLDIQKKRIVVLNFSRKLYGEVSEDYSFVISSRGKLATMYRFEGQIEDRGDGIYMSGTIRPKPMYQVIMYGLCIFLNLIGVSLTFSGGIWGILMICLGWLYFLILNRSNALYKHLILKLE
ncbi:MAG: hypothetical protein JEZ08_10565 [Clostridiales bacterium]|nr:hypothetical protein [Clostridiales bacterium]